MYVIKARNAHQALPEILYQLRLHGVTNDSRNGPVLRFPGPCTVIYEKPLERVVFWPQRDANPFFHVLESMWMLAGRNDVAYPASIVETMRDFSDDGTTFNGAYGHRWRHHFGYDQLKAIAHNLRYNLDDRRQVLSMWDGKHDPGHAEAGSKDVPCNTHAYFTVVEGKLDMMVCNRSNDIVWGALGANCVHFSYLQEYMANAIGVPVGRYWQVSNNMHLYVERHEKLLSELSRYAAIQGDGVAMYRRYCPYEAGKVRAMEAGWNQEQFDSEVPFFLEGEGAMGIRSAVLRRVAGPLSVAIREYQSLDAPDRFDAALEKIETMDKGLDWRVAASEWVVRRKEKWFGRDQDN
jgi:hypothetical protein